VSSKAPSQNTCAFRYLLGISSSDLQSRTHEIRKPLVVGKDSVKLCALDTSTFFVSELLARIDSRNQFIEFDHVQSCPYCESHNFLIRGAASITKGGAPANASKAWLLTLCALCGLRTVVLPFELQVGCSVETAIRIYKSLIQFLCTS
jgi:hypothetical protein